MKGEFYKMDYEAWDEGTDELTLEQEAAYLRLCHQLYRRKAAVPASPATLARIWRCHPNKARKLLADLVACGKIAEREGHLTNTRVTRELDARETMRTQRADAGHTGGTRSQENRRKSLQNNDPEEALAHTSLKQKQAEREKEGEKEDQLGAPHLSDPRGVGDFPPRAFDLWWERQPNKVGKDAARKAFERIRKSGRVTFAELMDGLLRYIATKPPHRDYCHPSTWLNQGRWADEPAPTVADPRAATPRPSGNGLSDLGKQKAQGDVSIYRDPFAHLDRPRAGRTSAADDERRAGPSGDAEGLDEAERGRLVDFDRMRTVAGRA